MKILLIDDIRNEAYIESTYGLRPTQVTKTYQAGIEALKNDGPFDVLYLDHDLASYEGDQEKTGYDILVFLEEFPEFLPKNIYIVSANPVGRVRMRQVIEKLYSGR